MYYKVYKALGLKLKGKAWYTRMRSIMVHGVAGYEMTSIVTALSMNGGSTS